MKKKTVFVLAIAVVVLSCAGYSNATVLGTIESKCTGLLTYDISRINIGMSYPVYLPGGHGIEGWDYSILVTSNIASNDVGKTFIINADNTPSFGAFTFFLTNGVDNSIKFTNCQLLKESQVISKTSGGVDLKGYKIESIELRVNDIFSYNDPVHVDFANWNYDITYTINGTELPEPATILLLGLGGLALRKRRKT